MFNVHRNLHNPILSPSNHPFDAMASFNASPVIVENKKTNKKEITLLYRAMSLPDPYLNNHAPLSIIAKAVSLDGNFFDVRMPFIVPSEDYDKYGCEDPRATYIDGKYFIFYTALGAYPYVQEHIRTALAISSDLKSIDEKHLITPFNSKAMMLFPEKIDGKYVALISINPDLKPIRACLRFFDRVEDMWNEHMWQEWYKDIEKYEINLKRKDDDHIELGAPPIKTDKGWLLIYSHIQRYASPEHVFGIEAALLDLENPQKVIALTKGPFLVPEMYYEKTGIVSNITFPTGALCDGDTITIYYGAADTHVATATLSLSKLLDAMLGKTLFTRSHENPIISPRPNKDWEKGGTLNPAAIRIDGITHFLYRAATDKNVSTFGYATSKDGIHIDMRSDDSVYIPRISFEKADGDNNYGCEDPRLMEIEGRIYMLYTGYNRVVPRVVVTSISKEDFIARRFENFTTPQAITHDSVADKDAIILPEKTKDGYFVMHRAGLSICGDYVSSLDFETEKVEKCIELTDPRYGMWDSIKVGVSTPAIKTEKGWLVLYHGISWSKIYRVGALLLDLDDPTIVLGRSTFPLFEPEEYYEKRGVVGNVVFPCGITLVDDTLFMYYGGADTTIGVATASLKEVLATLIN